eukprot:TRINITY_DN737_c0_g1_i1.p1 TRINITY_DN737_c0_g1~~TRINITY_DN737_c0_g1_i1.p1  ORF type:complete len:185 (+),score=16.80 TRINITY_DN737_c0_g1_i1:643-1197(+)
MGLFSVVLLGYFYNATSTFNILYWIGCVMLFMAVACIELLEEVIDKIGKQLKRAGNDPLFVMETKDIRYRTIAHYFVILISILIATAMLMIRSSTPLDDGVTGAYIQCRYECHESYAEIPHNMTDVELQRLCDISACYDIFTTKNILKTMDSLSWILIAGNIFAISGTLTFIFCIKFMPSVFLE